LDEVHDVFVGAPVLVRELDHEPQVRGDEARGRVDVLRRLVVLRERLLFFRREERVPLDLTEVGLKRVAS